MASALQAHRRTAPAHPSGSTRRLAPVACAATVAAVSRLVLWTVPQLSDESGYRFVAAQWHRGLGSLYGAYWVDRPPLLLELFAAASPAGATGVRALGLVASVMIVITAAGGAGSIAGPRARALAAFVAALLVASPLSGSAEVDGELLALPFVLGGIWAWVAATRQAENRSSAAVAALAGALATAALLVKQNFADVAVFAAASLVVVPAARRLRLIAAGVAGALLTAASVLAVAWQRGSSPLAVFDAMYPFRLKAGALLSRAEPLNAVERLHDMLRMSAGSVVPVAVVVLLLIVLRRRDAESSGAGRWWVALLAVGAFDVLSIAFGGNYWPHYLVQLVGPLAVLAGVCGRTLSARLDALALVALAGVGAVALAMTAMHPLDNPGTIVGSSIRRAADPGDTVTALYGQPGINATSGLRSPYPYLWSLPAKVRDSNLTLLEATLSGPQAPTWVVVVRTVQTWGVPTAATQETLDRDYVPVQRICGMTVYLHRGVARQRPSGGCARPESAVAELRELIR